MRLLAIILLLVSTTQSYATTFFVLNNADTGIGSLRQAILDANADANEPHIISFVNFTGPTEIRLGIATLPQIQKSMSIDATTHPSYSTTPIISINCMNVENNGLNYFYGEYNDAKIFYLTAIASGSIIRGFEIFDQDEPGSIANDVLVYAFEINQANNVKIIDNNIHDLNVGVNVINSSNSLIENNTATSITTLAYLSLECNQTTIKSNTVTQTTGPAFRIRGSGVSIENNTISTSTEPFGILIQNVFTSWGTGSNNTVKNNTIDDYFYGCTVQQTITTGSIIDPLTGNTIPTPPSSPARFNKIEKNIFTNIGSKAINLYYGTLSEGNEGKPIPTITSIDINSQIINGTGTPGDVIELFASNASQEAALYLSSITVGVSGNWGYQSTVNFSGYTYITATATDIYSANLPNNENTSELASILMPIPVCETNNGCTTAMTITESFSFDGFCNSCNHAFNQSFWFIIDVTADGQVLVLNEMSLNPSGQPYDFDYAIAPLANSSGICDPNLPNLIIAQGTDVSAMSFLFPAIGQYAIALSGLSDCPDISFNLPPPMDICETCIGSFAPVPGQDYLISAWAKDETVATNSPEITTYSAPQILLHFTEDDNGTITTTTLGPYTPSGAIIDQWQKIEEQFEIPANAIDMEIELISTAGDVLFDDIRVFPFDASMKTYVYDPINMRLAAELDERHYATFYEYDEEGKLIRIKKETEKGVQTIQETKSNASKGN